MEDFKSVLIKLIKKILANKMSLGSLDYYIALYSKGRWYKFWFLIERTIITEDYMDFYSGHLN